MDTRELDRIKTPGFRDYIQKQAARLLGNFKASRSGCDVDAVHDMRVAVKRLRTVLKCVKHLQPRFRRKRAYRPIRDVYKVAGDVRDFQVQRQLLASWLRHHGPAVDEFQSWLASSEEASCQRYLKVAGRFDTEVIVEVTGRIADAVEPLSVSEVVTGLNDRFSELFSNLIESGPADQLEFGTLHAVRISSKEARYCLEIIQACSGENETVASLDTALKRVHRALGVWHDYDVGLATLNRFHDRHAGEALWKRQDYRQLTTSYTDDRQDHLECFYSAWQHLRDLS